MEYVTAQHPGDKTLEAWITKNVYRDRTEHVRSVLKAFLRKHKTSPKTPEEIRVMLNKKISETESLSDDVISMRR
jgi:metal-responsive CopG/Arc/MetJ family transcriptional regulator